ncbi:hypothetical protein CYY_001115 [Polysphondylium violaceum]|uniref:IPT/TIG domain-containing protein n=1 Tax=Polysphondylium violaceum TaxID=133409 RepID=A0A8J4Q3R4_9MYCE|nr:hypothetical protein CYY_001115 [Polysphondylium violaceum]
MAATNNYYFTLFVLLFSSVFLFCNVNAVYTLKQFPLNQHWYERIEERVSGINATLFCEQKTYNGLKGYLATFSFEEEWAFTQANGVTTIATAWISGSDAVKTGFWTYSSGPEKGQPMYNLFFDKSYSFSFFGGIEPNLIPNEHWVHTSGNAAAPYWNNIATTSNISAYICEYGGLDDPVMPTITTTGGRVIITKLTGYIVSSLTITLTNRVTPTNTFQCGSIQVINSTSVSCLMPVGTGRYSVLIIDSAKKNHTLLWQYELPFIQSVNPFFKKDESITLAGNNFGTVASAISVLVGTSQTVVCGSVTILSPHVSISCKLPADLTEKLLPISVTVNSLKHITYKAAIFSPKNKLYYSGFLTNANWATSTDGYVKNLRVDGINAHLAVLDSPDLWTFLNNTLPIPFAGNLWNVWLGVTYNPTSKKFFYLAGPKAGTQAALQYTSIAGDQTTWTADTRFVVNLYTGVLQGVLPTAASGTFAEYGGEDPAFTTNKTHGIDTSGGSIGIQIDNYGTVFSVLSVLFRSASVSFVRDFINSELDVNIPIGYDGPYQISVTVDGKPTAPNTQFIDYNPPVISSIPSISTRGGDVTITGTSFFNDITKNTLTFGSTPCLAPTLVTAHKVLKCTMPVGTGVRSTTVKVGGKTSAPFTFSYIKPSVTTVSSVSPAGGTVTIDGDNFGADATKITVSVGSFACTGVVLTTAHTQFTCSVPQGQASHAVTVTVDTLVSNNNILLIYNSPTISSAVQISDGIEITGTNFGTDLYQLKLFIGASEITSYCKSTMIKVTCTALPATISSGAITTTGAYVNPSYNFLLTPFVVSVDPTSVATSGGAVSIKGKFFETTAMGTPTTLSVIFNGVTYSNNGYQSSSLLVFSVPAGTGVGKSISVKTDTRSSNSKTIAYIAPKVTSHSQTDETISLVGTNFGNDKSKISISIGSVPIDSATLVLTSHTQLSFKAPLESLNGGLLITVDTQSFTYSRFTLKPVITLIPAPKVIGEAITIQGKYLSNVDQDSLSTNIKFTFNSVVSECTFISATSYECSAPPGTGKAVAFVVNELVRSIDTQYLYQGPTIETVTHTIYNVPQEITISGTNFASTGLLVTIGDQDCQSPVAIDDTIITCQFESNATPGQGNLDVSVTVDGQSATEAIFAYASFSVSKVSQVQDYLQISGFNFGDVSKLEIKIGEVALTTCVGNNTFITCNPLPIDTKSGYFDITNGPSPITPIKVLLKPFIYTISPTTIKTVGENITMTGRFFEATSIAENNVIHVFKSTYESIEFDLIDNTTLIAKDIVGSGSSNSLEILIKNRKSNVKQFSYIPPTISTVQHVDTVLNVTGSNIGNQSSITIYYNGQEFNATNIDSQWFTITILENSTNGELYIRVADQESNKIRVLLKPNIKSIAPSPYTTGGSISLSGRFWNIIDSSNSPIEYKFYYSLLQSTDKSFKLLACEAITKAYTVVCKQPSGYGNFSVKVIAEGVESNQFVLNYQIPIVFSSSSLFYNTPGNITIHAQSIASPSSVFINNKECTNAVLTDTEHIRCFYDASVAPNQNGDPLTVTVTSYGLSGKNDVYLYLKERRCPGIPECSANGDCDTHTGVCRCYNSTITTSDCSIVDPNVLPPTTDENGETTLPTTGNFNYTIAITHLREKNLKEETVKTIKVSTIHWVDRKKLSEHTNYYKGGFENDPAILELQVTYFPTDSSIDFAGDILSMPANSVKYEITVSNWTFTSSMNYLQVIYNSRTERTTTYECVDHPTNITKLNVESLSWFQIVSGGNTLNSKFADRIIVDSRIVGSNVKLLEQTDELYNDLRQDSNTFNILTAMSTPYFKKNVVVDPNFSALLKTSTKTECDSSEKWKIPVIVVLSTAGGVSIATAAAVFYKKKLAFKKMEKSISMKSVE